MKGTIQKRGDSHRISVELPRGADGKRRRYYETVPSTRRRDAELRQAELSTDINSNRFVEPSTMLLSEYLRQWLQDYGTANVRPKTLVGYTDVVERHLIPKLGRVKLGELRPMHLERFKSEQLCNGRLDGSGDLSERSVAHYLTVLSHALNQAVKWNLVSQNVADGVSSPRVEEKEMRALSLEEIGRLMELAKDTHYFLPIHMALHTGMRRSELLGFQWRDLNMDRRELTVNRVLYVLPGSQVVFQPPKTRSSRRVIALPNATVLHLHAHREFMQSEATMAGRDFGSEERVMAGPTVGSCVLPP